MSSTLTFGRLGDGVNVSGVNGCVFVLENVGMVYTSSFCFWILGQREITGIMKSFGMIG